MGGHTEHQVQAVWDRAEQADQVEQVEARGPPAPLDRAVRDRELEPTEHSDHCGLRERVAMAEL